MRKSITAIIISPIFLTGVACAQQGSASSSDSNSRETPGRAWYAQHCATCHGVDMDGAGASSLVDGEWAFGGEREDIFRSIYDGIEDLGMPAYGGALDEEQINLIVDAIMGTESPAEESPREARQSDTIETLDYDVRVEKWADGFRTPWGIAFIDKATALVTERSGPLRLVEDGTLHSRPIADTPEVVAQGQGGMMAVSVDPDYEENGWIYLGYSHGIQRGGSTQTQTRIVRGKIDNHRWVDQEVVWEADPEHYTRGRVHFGVRIVFDSNGYLYFAIGDRGNPRTSQDLGSPNGKIHRLHRDGSIPEDNPFVNTSGALSSIYTYGHRNPQGLDFHPVTGDLWEGEHGPRGGDEINLIRAGKNYGWPELTHGINYN
ncbi:MAG: PQQ-dependent sugar dehydrogenase, partial [Candidatus Sumerlaeia bacterium]|nr:PQQ-dependent sugar dehydrogenase [Candidatus Sumerlaeia bacterium]